MVRSAGSSSGRTSPVSVGGSSALTMNVAEMILHGVADDEVMSTWLSSVGCSEYAKQFIDSGYNMPTIARMTPQDLSAVGVNNPDHRLKILAEIKKLNLLENKSTETNHNSQNIKDDTSDGYPRDLKNWLESISLDQEYYKLLYEQNFDNLEKVSKLTWEDLEEIGIHKLGHQKRLLLAIEKLNEYQTRANWRTCKNEPIYDTCPNQLILVNKIPINKNPIYCQPQVLFAQHALQQQQQQQQQNMLNHDLNNQHMQNSLQASSPANQLNAPNINAQIINGENANINEQNTSSLYHYNGLSHTLRPSSNNYNHNINGIDASSTNNQQKFINDQKVYATVGRISHSASAQNKRLNRNPPPVPVRTNSLRNHGIVANLSSGESSQISPGALHRASISSQQQRMSNFSTGTMQAEFASNATRWLRSHQQQLQAANNFVTPDFYNKQQFKQSSSSSLSPNSNYSSNVNLSSPSSSNAHCNYLGELQSNQTIQQHQHQQQQQHQQHQQQQQLQQQQYNQQQHHHQQKQLQQLHQQKNIIYGPSADDDQRSMYSERFTSSSTLSSANTNINDLNFRSTRTTANSDNDVQQNHHSRSSLQSTNFQNLHEHQNSRSSLQNTNLQQNLHCSNTVPISNGESNISYNRPLMINTQQGDNLSVHSQSSTSFSTVASGSAVSCANTNESGQSSFQSASNSVGGHASVSSPSITTFSAVTPTTPPQLSNINNCLDNSNPHHTSNSVDNNLTLYQTSSSSSVIVTTGEDPDFPSPPSFIDTDTNLSNTNNTSPKQVDDQDDCESIMMNMMTSMKLNSKQPDTSTANNKINDLNINICGNNSICPNLGNNISNGDNNSMMMMMMMSSSSSATPTSISSASSSVSSSSASSSSTLASSSSIDAPTQPTVSATTITSPQHRRPLPVWPARKSTHLAYRS